MFLLNELAEWLGTVEVVGTIQERLVVEAGFHHKLKGDFIRGLT